MKDSRLAKREKGEMRMKAKKAPYACISLAIAFGS